MVNWKVPDLWTTVVLSPAMAAHGTIGETEEPEMNIYTGALGKIVRDIALKRPSLLVC